MPVYEDSTDDQTLDFGSDAAILKEGLRCFQLGTEAWNQQRKNEQADLEFQDPDRQWTAEESAQRAMSNITTKNGQVNIPARPKLTIPLLDQPIRLIDNQAQKADLGINVHPESDDADSETADVIQDIIRAEDEASNAEEARLWAFRRADRGGFGWYRINTEYDDSAPEDDISRFDQRITVERILHQEAVIIDPAATKSDFSDAEWAFVCAWIPLEDFKRQYEGSRFAVDPGAWAEAYNQTPNWVRMNGDSRAVLVVEYFKKHHTKRRLALLADRVTVVDAEKVPEGQAVVAEREWDDIRLMVYKHTALEVLDKQEWHDHLIPLIPVPGRELIPFNGERYWYGMIRPARGPQKFENFAASSLVERMGLEPRIPYTGDPRQIQGYEELWQQANVRNLSFLPQNFVIGAGGQPLPAIQRMQVDSSGMSIALQGVEQGKNFIQQTTGVFDPSLGQLNNRDRSGKAVLALQGQMDAGTSDFLDTLANVSMRYEARVRIRLIGKIYDREGRIVRAKDEEGNQRPVMLNAPFVEGRNGMPQQVPMAGPDGRVATGAHKMYDVRRGRHGVSVTIGKSFQTRQQQATDEMGNVIQAAPEMMLVMGDLYFANRDFPGHKAISERMKRYINMKTPGLIEKEGPQASEEQLKAENQALKQKLQEAQQGIAQMTDALKTDQVKQQAALQKQQMADAAKVETTEIQARAKLMGEQMNAAADMALQRFKAGVEAIEAEKQRRHELELEQYKATTARVNAEAQADREDAREREGADRDDMRAEADRQAEAQADGAGE